MGDGKLGKETKVIIRDEKNFKIIKANDGQKYYFNKKLFIFSAVAILFIAIGTLIDYNDMETHYYMECTDNEQCFNPYYQSLNCGRLFPADSKICTQEYFMPGESDGEKPSILVSNGLEMTLLFLLALFLFNHVTYNNNFKFKFNKEDTL